MDWLFRSMPKNEVERDVTQRSQFDTDEARIEATLIREAHQNSLDAKMKGSSSPVRTRISFFTPHGNEDYFESIFAPLKSHLQASKVDLTEIDFRKPTFVIIEDFGTTGLTGKWDAWDDAPFSDFWRREGRSHKSGSSNGRWGLGKLVFSSASRIRTFFGLTVRHDVPGESLLMGQAVLMTHEIGGNKFVPYGFFANEDKEQLQLPETDPAEIAKFRDAVGISRSDEPGFTVAIPFPIEQLSPKSLIEGVLKHYFFPILTGQLEVQVDGELINSTTFDSVAAKYMTNELRPELIAFIRKIDHAQKAEPDIILNSKWVTDIESAIGPEKLTELRHAFTKEDTLIHARVPISLRKIDGTAQETYFDLFLMKGAQGTKGESLYIRSTITVPNESRYFSAADTFAALIAKDEPIAGFLGDAENPAHTQWNGSAEKLKEQWKAGSTRLSEIRNSLRLFYKALGQLEEFTEQDALLDFFSIEDMEAGKKRKKAAVKPRVPEIPAAKKAYRIAARKGGFAIRPGGGLSPEELPVIVKVRVAYDVLSGNPLKRYDPLDFRLDQAPITIEPKGAEIATPAPNSLEIEITDVNFSVDVNGFDVNRDLLVDARKETK